MKKRFTYPLIFIGISFLASCATNMNNRGYLAPEFTTPLRVAVLPLENQTSDLKANELYRLMFKNSLQDLGFTVAKNGDVDYILNQKGYTDGGQLRNTPKDDICEWLGVDVVVFGSIEKASQLTTGVYNKKEVKTSMQMYKQNRLIWADTASASSSEVGLSVDAMANAVVKRIGDKAFAKFNGHPLIVLTESQIVDIQRRLPGKRVEPTGWEASK
jgi:hypothetical protein